MQLSEMHGARRVNTRYQLLLEAQVPFLKTTDNKTSNHRKAGGLIPLHHHYSYNFECN